MLLLLLLEKRSQESLNYKLNSIEKLLRLRRPDSLTKRRKQNVKRLKLRRQDSKRKQLLPPKLRELD